MARKVKMDFTGVESYSKASEGRHTVKVADIEQKTSSGGDDMLQFAFEVIKGADKGSRVFDNFVLTDKALWKFKACLQALGMKADGKIVIDLDKILGKICDIEVFHEEYNGQMRAKISDYYKVAAKAADDDEDEADDEDLDDEDEEEEEEEEVKPAKKSKPAKAPAKAAPKKRKPEPEPEEDDEDDDEDEEDEDEEEEPAPKKRKAAAPAKKAPAKKRKPEPEPEDDDDDEDWEEE